MGKKASDDFERFIERIHRLIESQDSKVTWNDRIVDPDNPARLRQIDVSIVRDNRRTHVECRIHQAAQDVQWIEELIGRRTSLKADAMIAVSASGFTQGAVKKAMAYGIILRTLDTLSEQEIEAWGKPTNTKIVYYEFTAVEITFRLPSGSRIADPVSITDDSGKPLPYRGLFELVMNKVSRETAVFDADASQVFKFSATVFSPLLINGIRPTECSIKTNVRRIVRKLSLTSVVAYVGVGCDELAANTYIQKYQASGFEVLQNADEVAVVVDLSNVRTPPCSLLHTVQFDFGRAVRMKWVQPIGLIEAMDYAGSMSIRIALE